MDSELEQFLERLNRLPKGYSTGVFDGARYATNITYSADEKRIKLFAENLASKDHVSFNLYFLQGGKHLLRPCEMPQKKVVDFVLGYVPDTETPQTV